MKIYKIIPIVAVGFLTVACSDDDKYNTASGVVVNMENTVLQVPEAQESNDDYYYIPFNLTGEPNGPVRVTVECIETGNEPAVADKNYIVTSYTYTIPAGAKSGSIQFYPVDDEDFNENRTFTAKIARVEGAEIGSQSSTLVELMDDEIYLPPAYQDIQGVYELHTVSNWNGEGVGTGQIIGVNEGEAGFNRTLYFIGVDQYSVFEGRLGFNAAKMEAYVNFNLSQTLFSANFGGEIGVADVKLAYYDFSDEKKQMITNGSVKMKANKDYTILNFDILTGYMLGCIVYKDGSPYSFWDAYSEIYMMR